MVRRSAALAASATLALGLPARPQGGPATLLAGPPDAEVEIEADHVTYLYEAQVLRLEGHVVARRGEGVLRAGKGALDRAHGLLSLEGGVLGVQGRQVFLADSAMVDLDKHSADLGSAVLYLKERPADPQNPRSGKNALVLHGKRVRQLGLEGRYAPVAGTSGSLSLDLFDDWDQRDSPAVPSPAPGEPGRSRGRGLDGVRGVAHFTHRTEREATVIAAQANIATDVRAV